MSVGNPGKDMPLQRQRELEEMVAVKTAKLAASNRELQHFAYVASHDLQEPLRTITGFAQLLARRYQGKLDREGDEFIGFILDGTQRMKALVDDLLAYSRVESKAKPFIPFAMQKVLDRTLANLRESIVTSGATVTADPLPEIAGDEVQIGQLLQNLIANAVKFRGEEPPRVHVAFRDLPEEWEFSVSDNGIGIDPEFFERIFIVFQRLHTSDRYPGTGIGLSICKKIVERHGGSICVQSEPGRGATFFFTISKKPHPVDEA